MVYVTCETTGSVYTLDPMDDETLLCAPMCEDGTFDTSLDSWSEVDMEQVDEPVIYDTIEHVHNNLLFVSENHILM